MCSLVYQGRIVFLGSGPCTLILTDLGLQCWREFTFNCTGIWCDGVSSTHRKSTSAIADTLSRLWRNWHWKFNQVGKLLLFLSYPSSIFVIDSHYLSRYLSHVWDNQAWVKWSQVPFCDGGRAGSRHPLDSNIHRLTRAIYNWMKRTRWRIGIWHLIGRFLYSLVAVMSSMELSERFYGSETRSHMVWFEVCWTNRLVYIMIKWYT